MGWWGWVASPRRAKTAIRAQTVVLCSQQTTGMYTNHRIDRDGHWQQFGTQPILISAPQWASWSYNAPTGFYRVGKKPSVKADQAIYSQAVDVRGRCMSESLRLGHNLDFSSCDIMVGFHKSSHIFRSIVLLDRFFQSIVSFDRFFQSIVIFDRFFQSIVLFDRFF